MCCHPSAAAVPSSHFFWSFCWALRRVASSCWFEVDSARLSGDRRWAVRSLPRLQSGLGCTLGQAGTSWALKKSRHAVVSLQSAAALSNQPLYLATRARLGLGPSLVLLALRLLGKFGLQLSLPRLRLMAQSANSPSSGRSEAGCAAHPEAPSGLGCAPGGRAVGPQGPGGAGGVLWAPGAEASSEGRCRRERGAIGAVGRRPFRTSRSTASSVLSPSSLSMTEPRFSPATGLKYPLVHAQRHEGRTCVAGIRSSCEAARHAHAPASWGVQWRGAPCRTCVSRSPFASRPCRWSGSCG